WQDASNVDVAAGAYGVVLQAVEPAVDQARRDSYMLEAELRRDAGDLAGELDAYARGLAAYPDEPELLYARGLAWERRDDIPRAEADLRRILVIDPENVAALRSEEHTSELQSRENLVCRLLLEKKKQNTRAHV